MHAPPPPPPDLAAAMAALDNLAVVVPQPRPAGSPALDHALRELLGEPLVRKHRRTDEAWSFLCPRQTCQSWRVGYQELWECRVGWFAHCAEVDHGPGFAPSWPAGAEFECEVFQPVSEPDVFSRADVLFDLARAGRAVDRAGRPLRYAQCGPCAGLPLGDGELRHWGITGRTCVRQVTCPTCGAEPGAACDRSRDEWRMIQHRPSQQGAPGAHEARFDAAADEELARAEAGDDTVPAAWLPVPPPSKRPTRRHTTDVQWRATLVVRAPSDFNDDWKGVVFEHQALGRLWWSDRCTVAHIPFETAEMAEWTRGFLVQFCGIPAEVTEVLPSVDPDRNPGLARRVAADAEQVFARATAETPVNHLVWAFAAMFVRDVAMFLPGQLDAGLARERFHTHGGSAGRAQISCDGSRVEAVWAPGRPESRKVSWTWSRVAQLLGDLPPDLAAEVRAACEERGAYPRGSFEFRRAERWGEELAAAVWLSCRPTDLAPFDDRPAFAR